MSSAGDLKRSMIHHFHVRGMECASCIHKVHSALTSISGVLSAKVSLEPPEAEVVMASHVAVETMNEALKAVGQYSLESLAPDDQQKATSMFVQKKTTFFPLLLLLGFLLGGVILREFNRGFLDSHSAMSNFMGGFLSVFSFFKLLDLKGFADTFQSYDFIAERSREYAFAYPFIELALGVLYFIGFAPTITNVLTLVLMTVGGVGAIRMFSNQHDTKLFYARTFLNLPSAKIALLEALTMGAFAIIALSN